MRERERETELGDSCMGTQRTCAGRFFFGSKATDFLCTLVPSASVVKCSFACLSPLAKGRIIGLRDSLGLISGITA